uniref:DUF4515 domain-containing protein n=1 Tax=Leptobrachium leishanense TaxID=445787 RepID=A0A8C5QBQ1_9ANUR
METVRVALQAHIILLTLSMLRLCDGGSRPLFVCAGPKDHEKEAVASARELVLQQENQRLAAEHEVLRRKLEQLRRENGFLQEEAEQIREDSQEYMSYMNKRSQRRQDNIISLSDQNLKQLEDMRLQKKELEVRFQEEEAKLREQILQRESNQAKLSGEIHHLMPMKELQSEQLLHIKELIEEVMATRGRHAEALLRVKSAFLRDKKECQLDSEHQMGHLSQTAHTQAKKALMEASSRMKEENQHLRQDLLHLIHQAQVLQAQKQKLEDQNQNLRREEQCCQELRTRTLHLQIS